MKRAAPQQEQQEELPSKKASVPGPVIRFFGEKKNDDHGFLSNFAPAPIILDGLEWPNTEAYYQASKFSSQAHRERIRRARTPYKAKMLGGLKRGRWPDKEVEEGLALAKQEGVAVREDWEQIKEQMMEKALMAKFTQHAELAAKLVATRPARLEEASPYDNYWGTGKSGKGKNRLGHLLMEVREKI